MPGLVSDLVLVPNRPKQMKRLFFVARYIRIEMRNRPTNGRLKGEYGHTLSQPKEGSSQYRGRHMTQLKLPAKIGCGMQRPISDDCTVITGFKSKELHY